MARTILTVFGTRPEAIKLFPLVHALDGDDRFVSRVCVTGQHRGMLDQVLDIAGIAPDHDLDVMQPNQSLDALTARLLTGIGQAIDAERPDWVVVQGDTATAMCGALAAYYRKIPVAHVEAGGLASVSINYEELGRRAGEMAVRILTEGANPADMPIETMTADECDLVYNQKTADELGIDVSSLADAGGTDVSA